VKALHAVHNLGDIKEDPHELHNLIKSPAHQEIVKRMNQRLFEILESTDGMNMPLYRDKGGVNNLRNPNGPKAAPFPKAFEK
jgi:N-acetylglucosamine-6-sulfatase